LLFCRHETAVIAALLHDVLDDTAATPEQITGAFGPAVSAMVVKVSKLSQVNQMLRRDKRKVRVVAQRCNMQPFLHQNVCCGTCGTFAS
jgi:(p)ppGpp synthase/HD superfamily hydrolase